ncbi:hypothetical protein DPM19_03665 [Actinomadura craniellae]|uniref:Uncharacterized protein n=1 Tax=Actinomadura craniellae TaxID=2231787 RepID=A0A365HA70_9ACTN|nr:hypothetical protein [Actinomadura craniellae]RAY16044.1 hypothetical protein DPM19_03665 [Actinomadura craniellae]
MTAHVGPRGSAERLVIAATIGPTIHDTHAWRFQPAPGLIEIVADPARFRPRRDPRAREVHLSCGAALTNLRLAAAQLGRQPVFRLLPDPSRPALLATARLSGRHRVCRSERLMYAATLRPFPALPAAGVPPPRTVLTELAEAARLEGAALRFAPQDPATAVLVTGGDSPAQWLRAGQALQRVLLTASIHAVSASFAYAVDGGPPRDRLHHGDVPQVVLRLARRTLPRHRAVHHELERHRDGDGVRQPGHALS